MAGGGLSPLLILYLEPRLSNKAQQLVIHNAFDDPPSVLSLSSHAPCLSACRLLFVGRRYLLKADDDTFVCLRRTASQMHLVPAHIKPKVIGCLSDWWTAVLRDLKVLSFDSFHLDHCVCLTNLHKHCLHKSSAIFACQSNSPYLLTIRKEHAGTTPSK